jgi:hypothetical protein
MFKKVLITKDMIDVATERAKKIPNNRHTFMDFERHKVGFIGEEIFKSVFPMSDESKGSNVYYYDYILGKRKIEIKTKMVKTEPRMSYECSIYNYFQQRPDYYFFCRVLKKNNEYPYGWLLGYISEREFKEKNYFVPKGEMQSNGFVTRIDTWNLAIEDLYPVDNILEKMRGQ